jgi:hypothetical protein
MKNGPKTKRPRPPRPAASFNGRAKSSTVPPAYRVSQNAQRNYERYLELGRAEALAGNPVEAENYYQHAEHYFRSMSAVREKQLAPAGGIKANGASPWGSLEGRRPTPRVG